MDGRTIQGDFYRRGFNGMEKDDEVKGGGNSYDFGARMYDSRVGRWLTIDPLAANYPDVSPYLNVANNPLFFKDPDGKRIFIYYDSGKKDSDGNPIIKSYDYGSGLKLPKDKFVKETFKTLKKLEKNNDPLGLINIIKNDTENHVAISLKTDWNSSSFIIEVGQAILQDENGNIISTQGVKLPPDLISWSPNTGLIDPSGTKRSSAARGLLHEIGHKFYNIFDPLGVNAKYTEIMNSENLTETEKQNQVSDLYNVGNFHNPADKWIIENVEVNFKKEWKRDNHNEGYFLKTRGNSFSKRGKIAGRYDKTMSVKEIKKGGKIEKDTIKNE
jgi:RHS repeat-associated protein